MKKPVQLCLIALIWLCLIAGLVRAAALPKPINEYELRPARQLPPLSWDSYASGSFQDGVEAALTDQLPLSQYLKKAYNLASSYYLRLLIDPIARRDPELVVNYNGERLYQGYLLYPLSDFEQDRPLYDKVIDSYNRAAAELPDIPFTYYLIESDFLYDFIRGRSIPFYAYLRESLQVPEERIGRLELRDFDDYRRCFLRTDHHWTAQGSYQAYGELAELLGIREPLLQPVGERILPDSYGTKAASARLPAFTERVQVYFFDYPDLGVRYGSEEQYRDGSLSAFSYGIFYGADEAEIVFDTGRPERETLLVLGDSYDNAILKLLASHFNKTYSVDLRYYPCGEDGFDLADYVRRNGIDRVLVVGSMLFFQDGSFAVRS